MSSRCRAGRALQMRCGEVASDFDDPDPASASAAQSW